MRSHTSRRDVLRAGTSNALGAALLAGITGGTVLAEPPKAGTDAAKLWPGYPRHDPKLVAEIVGVSHFNEARVRELVKASPELVNACWDWGFGDWESPLGAAAHTGQRGIAEFLLAHGARIDIFAAAMLGHTAVVKAFVVAQPGIQRTAGPHGIALLDHAKAGGKPAADTLDYLESLGDAGGASKVVPLKAEDRKKYVGSYACKGPDLKVTCRLNKAERLVLDLRTADNASDGRLIHYLGDDEFFPAGVPSVRFRFALDQGTATTLTIKGLAPELTLQRAAME